MKTYRFIFKYEICSSFLPNNNLLVSPNSIEPFVDNGLVWTESVEGLNLKPSPSINSATYLGKINVINGSTFYVRVKSKYPSARIAKKDADIIASNFSALLSIATQGGRCFFVFRGASMENADFSANEIEGTASIPLRMVAYHTQSLDDNMLRYILAVTEQIPNDKIIKYALDNYSQALELDLVRESHSSETLMRYYKVIELITNRIIKKIKLDNPHFDSEREAVIDALQASLIEASSAKDKLARFREAKSNLAVIEHQVAREKTKSAARYLGIAALDDVEAIVLIRNTVLAHSDLNAKLDEQQVVLFRELSKMFFRRYVETFHPGVIKPESYLSKQFSDREGYFVSANYPENFFKGKR